MNNNFLPIIILIIVSVSGCDARPSYHTGEIDYRGDITVCDRDCFFVEIDPLAYGCTESCYERLIPLMDDVRECDKFGKFSDKSLMYRCIVDFAKRNKDMSLCAKPDLPESESSNCYIEVAEAHLYPESCSRIKNEESRDFCYENLLKKTNNHELCLKLSKDLQYFCLRDFASVKRQSDICELLSDKTEEELCYKWFLQETLDEGVCGKIDEPYIYCTRLEAVKARDPVICERLGGGDIRSCLDYYGLNIGNLTYCIDHVGKNKCVPEYAISTNNPALCNTLDSQRSIDSCMKAYDSKASEL